MSIDQRLYRAWCAALEKGDDDLAERLVSVYWAWQGEPRLYIGAGSHWGGIAGPVGPPGLLGLVSGAAITADVPCGSCGE